MLLFWGLLLFITSASLVKSNSIPIIGLTTGVDKEAGAWPARRNINELETEAGPSWDLFIRALSALEDDSESEEGSYFGVAGDPFHIVASPVHDLIRGMRRECSTPAPADHKQQILGQKVQQLANEYSGKDASAYTAAGQAFRLPYWDWASDARIPPPCTRQNITVNAPKGPITIRNPLYSYQWHQYPLDQGLFPGSESLENETTRSPNPTSHFPVEEVTRKLAAQAQQIKLKVQYYAFAFADTYEKMASMSGNGNSFESPHNDVHNLVGGSFATLTVTSFDPLFMLHHCNLDRLAAMWAAINFEKTVQTTSYQSGGLFATPKGEDITADSPLKPFYQADGKTFHTSRSVRDIAQFGYTYPELQDLDLDVHQNALRVTELVNDLYGSLPARRVRRPHPRGYGTQSLRELVVSVEVERSELELPCTINIYRGDGYAGRTTLLDMPRNGILFDEIPLAGAISASEFRGMSLDAVEDLLEKELHFEIKKDDGTVLDPMKAPSLRLDVQGFDLKPPSSLSEFPKYSGKHTYSKVFAQYNGTRTLQ
ncbi:hypothetical protein DL764_008588 [Monosporascus ibericus]|uniref:tyrosinase n=1 Tax=Monosporascus ibericus TaxID=155417 RepID=A0A4Q4SX56_9PEZI|nr:hypothetical protein DL764_008588 [Monosporascus ibericus]